MTLYSFEALQYEREHMIKTLRLLCQTYGSNAWEDNLFIPDILRKHLEKYLDGQAVPTHVEAGRMLAPLIEKFGIRHVEMMIENWLEIAEEEGE